MPHDQIGRRHRRQGRLVALTLGTLAVAAGCSGTTPRPASPGAHPTTTAAIPPASSLPASTVAPATTAPPTSPPPSLPPATGAPPSLPPASSASPSLPPATNSPAPTIPRIEVANYGAVGNGETDDTMALQHAMDATRASGPVVVHIPMGMYLISAPLRYDSDLVLVGDGMDATTITNTTARKNGTAMFVPLHAGVHDVRVSGLSFDQRGDWYDRGGASRHEYLLDVGATMDVTIQDIGFHNVRTMAAYSDTPRSSPTVGLRLIGNHVFESNGGGFSLFGAVQGVEISGNVVEHTKDDAIAVQDHAQGDDPTDVVVTGNTIRNCTDRTQFGSTPNGILIFGADNVTVDGNNISRVLSNGIRVGSGAHRRGTDIRVTNNTVRSAGANNHTADVPANGIFVIGADKVTLSYNDVEGSKDDDYRTQDSTAVAGP
jgi:hypothetical protein